MSGIWHTFYCRMSCSFLVAKVKLHEWRGCVLSTFAANRSHKRVAETLFACNDWLVAREALAHNERTFSCAFIQILVSAAFNFALVILVKFRFVASADAGADGSAAMSYKFNKATVLLFIFRHIALFVCGRSAHACELIRPYTRCTRVRMTHKSCDGSFDGRTRW